MFVVRTVCSLLENVHSFFYRPNGVTFVASPTTTAFATKWNLKEGNIITFKHSGYWMASKKPKTPSIYRVRPDKTWEDVVKSFETNKPASTPISKQFVVTLDNTNSLFISSTCPEKTNEINKTYSRKRILAKSRESTRVPHQVSNI
jgi:hypothetical protein